MKTLLTILGAFWAISSFGATSVLDLSTDHATYSAGSKAVVRAMLASKPEDETMEFDVTATMNGAPVALSRVTEYEFFSVSAPLVAGSYSISATVYLQDARLARDLKTSLAYFTQQIQIIDGQLAVETDPAKIAQLQAEKARYQGLVASTNSQFSSIRTLFYGPVSTAFQVN